MRQDTYPSKKDQRVYKRHQLLTSSVNSEEERAYNEELLCLLIGLARVVAKDTKVP